MSIVLRKHGNEKYYKPSTATVKQMISFGLIQKYSKAHGYCDESEDTPTNRIFSWKGSLYKIEYFSGCFYPFLLAVNTQVNDFGVYIVMNSDRTEKFKRTFTDAEWNEVKEGHFWLYKHKNADRGELIKNMSYYFKERVMTPAEA